MLFFNFIRKLKIDQSKQPSSAAKKALISTVKNQVKNNEPPETRLTYFRLLGLGIENKVVYLMLAQALAYEMFQMRKEERDFDPNNYVKLLNKLPFEDDDE